MQNPPTYMVDSPAIVVRQATKSYLVTDSKSRHIDSQRVPRDGENVVHALSNVSFVASSGESIGLIGRNGSGKSTLLKLIAGTEPLSAGEIYVKARPKLLGVTPALQPYLTGRKNILLGCLAMGLSRSEAEDIAPSIAEWSEIGDAIDRPMSTYSAGQNARLVFAISTAVRPEILLVDEALSTGDASFAKKAERRMKDMLSGAGNLFLVSHNTAQIRQNCDRVIWIHQGEVFIDSSASDILPQYDEWSALVAAKKHDSAGRLVQELQEQYLDTIVKLSDEVGTTTHDEFKGLYTIPQSSPNPRQG